MTGMAMAGVVPPITVNMRALAYKNNSVVNRIMEEGNFPREEAQEIFDDTLKFLALADTGYKLAPAARIDLGWHNFILHTVDYAKFCDDNFGRFIHHVPNSGLTCSSVGTCGSIRMDAGSRLLNLEETADLARSVFGDISDNWTASKGATCGSGGC